MNHSFPMKKFLEKAFLFAVNSDGSDMLLMFSERKEALDALEAFRDTYHINFPDSLVQDIEGHPSILLPIELQGKELPEVAWLKQRAQDEQIIHIEGKDIGDTKAAIRKRLGIADPSQDKDVGDASVRIQASASFMMKESLKGVVLLVTTGDRMCLVFGKGKIEDAIHTVIEFDKVHNFHIPESAMGTIGDYPRIMLPISMDGVEFPEFVQLKQMAKDGQIEHLHHDGDILSAGTHVIAKLQSMEVEERKKASASSFAMRECLKKAVLFVSFDAREVLVVFGKKAFDDAIDAQKLFEKTRNVRFPEGTLGKIGHHPVIVLPTKLEDKELPEWAWIKQMAENKQILYIEHGAGDRNQVADIVEAQLESMDQGKRRN